MKKDKPKKFRHELKYIISEREKEILKSRLLLIMQADAHATGGSYMIRSLYFDDIYETAMEEKMAGTNSRKKYRIRIYDYLDRVIRLECKEKQGQFICKQSAALTREELDKVLHDDYAFLLQREERVCQDFYLECMEKRMRPKVIVDYDREPLVYEYGDVRITFDEHVRAGVFLDNLFDDTVPVFEVLEPHQLILEVKYTEYLPEMIHQLIYIGNSVYTAASKYTMCLEKKKEIDKA